MANKLWLPKNVRDTLIKTDSESNLPCPYCDGKNVIRKGYRENRDGQVQKFFCNDCERIFTPKEPVEFVPKIKVEKQPYVRKSRICKKCGKEFIPENPFTSQQYCYNPCYPVGRIRKTKSSCEICGRFLGRSRIPIDSPEQVICSFCYKRKVMEREQIRENERSGLTPRKCKSCGNYAFLVRYSGLCRVCYEKSKNPYVLEIKEVRENVS